ncbi:MAG: hypothetical protein JJU36_07155 [Phycisphaeraceae bacterium]|nr:hypothetical protein [Phycisphaeraceae bacterium]
MPDTAALDRHFPRYRRFDPAVPAWCCTPGEGRSLHRFFDTPAISPDGRLLAVCRLPFEDRLNEPGEIAHVVVIDLDEGGERIVAETRGWEFQMGCNLNWAGDRVLVFNDVDTAAWRPVVVRLDLESDQSQRWPGGVYQVSPDGRWAAAASMEKMRRTQPGYGVLVPDDRSRQNVGAVDDDGLFITDLQTGERRLLLSLRDAIRVIPELNTLSESELEKWEIYGFHSKWSPRGDRLIFTIRRYPNTGHNRFNAFARRKEGVTVRFDVLTLRPDGSELHNAVPADAWERGGHHINFFPDGEHLSANIRLPGDEEVSLIQVRCDGADLGRITHKTIGSGHPTIHPDGRHILTDTYTMERMAYPDGTVPLRWIDRRADTEREVLRIGARVDPQPDPVMRVDPHPAWDRSWRWVVFNGVDQANTRRVYVADFGGLTES